MVVIHAVHDSGEVGAEFGGREAFHGRNVRDCVREVKKGEGRKPFVNHKATGWVHQPQEVAIPVVKIRMVLRLLAEDGWVLVATRGSHRQFEHPVKSGRVTVAGKDSDDLAPGTFNPILKQAKKKGP
jgi:predicted RNA binding protein YcfA (HicA-like mRNA interferase family)